MSVAWISVSSGGYRLHVVAHDDLSGVGKLQYAASRSGRVATINYRQWTRVRRLRSARWVRVIDRAGNYSHWRRVKVVHRRRAHARAAGLSLQL